MRTMDEHTDFWNLRYYTITKTILRILGYWPYQSRNEFLTCRTVVCFLCSLQIIPQIFAVIRWHNDIDIVTEVSNCFIVDSCFIANMFTFQIHYDKMRVLLDQIQEDWTIFPENNGRHMLHKSTEIGRKFTVLHSGIIFAASFIFVTEPVHVRIFRLFVKSNETLPLRFAIPVYYGSVDVEKYYWYILILSGICIFFILLAILAGDVLLFVYAQHICGMFGALGFAIENLPVNGKSSKCDDDYAYNYVRKCSLVHRRAIEFANSVEDIYTWNFFAMLGLNMLGISLTAVQGVMHRHQLERLMKTLFFTIGETIHLFIQCYMAQSILDSSLHIQQNLMNARWYDSTPRVKQLLQFMTMRSQISCELTVGKVTPLSLNVFCTIIRTSATYFTVFMDMQ